MYRYLTEKKTLFAGNLLLMATSTLCGIGFAFVLSRLLDYGVGGSKGELIHFLIFACFYCLATVALEWGYAISKHALLQSAGEALKNDLFQAALRTDIIDFEARSSSYYLNIMTTKSDMCANLYFRSCLEVPGLALEFLLGVAASIYVEPMMLGIMLACAILTVWAMGHAGKRVEASSKEFSDETSRYVQGLKDYFEGFRPVKLFQIERHIEQKQAVSNRTLEEKRFRNRKDMETASRFGEVVGILSTVLITGTAALFALSGRVTVGAVLALAQLMGKIVSPIASFANVRVQLKAAKPVVEEFEQILSNVPRRKGLTRLVNTDAPDITGDFRLEGVSFTYPEGEAEVLRDVTVTFEKGKKYAISGKSGSGKSTLLSLLLGWYPMYEGSLALGGKQLRDVDRDYLYGQIGYMAQEPFLFEDTVRNNITLFRDCPEERVWEAVRKAGIEDLVRNMPEGLDAMLEEGGRNLSGGERKRLCLARLLLEDAPYLILDEAEAHLDAGTASQIEEMLLSQKDKTIIAVMHNPDRELLKRYDGVFAMEEGALTPL